METEDEVIIQESIPTMDAELFASGNITVINNNYGGGGASYTHNQITPANDWVIVHNLGFIPSQEKSLDSAGDECFGAERIDETINGFTQRWPGGQFSGKTILS